MVPARARLALLWHMHQPYYLDPGTGESILPWVRLHALKDYWGMVALLDEFPAVPVTFNLVPSLVEQVQAYAEERTWDRHLTIGLAEAESVAASDAAWFVREAFHAHAPTMILPFPRYAELARMRAAGAAFAAGDLRDLQVWQKLAWVDPDLQRADPRVVRLMGKGRAFDEHDKRELRAVELDVLRRIVPAYARAEAAGRIELSTSPYFHPILPLLCDSAAHHAAHPSAPLPHPPFRRPGDAALQLQRAIDAHARWFGHRPRGVWPSEGSVSDAASRCIAEAGFAWMATDEDILARSLGRGLDAAARARPYELTTSRGAVRMLFRDHALSDLVGFTYQSWEASAAAADFVQRVRHVAHAARGGDAGTTPVVTVILDGENAWEHYAGGGRPFLRALYGALAAAPDLEPVPMATAASGPAAPLRSIFAGSWINADFGIWIGHADDRRAWRQLGQARAALDAAVAAGLDASRSATALDAILAAEGSDWFWWYGDDHSSAHDREFDGLFRHHLQRCYEALGWPAPDELHTSNISTRVHGATFAPGAVAIADGWPESHFSQLGASALETAASTMHEVAGGPDAHALVGLTASGLVVWAETGDRRLDGWTFESRRLDGDRPDAWVAEPLTAELRRSWVELGARPGDRVALRLVKRDAGGHAVRTVPADDSVRVVAVPGSGAARRPWSA